MTPVMMRQAEPASEALPDRPAAENHVTRFRPNELHRLRKERYGRVITPDDDGLILIEVTLDSLASAAEPHQRMLTFLELHAPWMKLEERERAIDLAIQAKKSWSASALGEAIKLTRSEREKLRIRTFRAAGMTDADMAAVRKSQNAESKRQARLHKRLHPEPRVSKPASRAAAILKLLKIGDWVDLSAIGAELKRQKAIPFSDVTAGAFKAALHRAVEHAVADGCLLTRKVPGPKGLEALQVCRCK